MNASPPLTDLRTLPAEQRSRERDALFARNRSHSWDDRILALNLFRDGSMELGPLGDVQVYATNPHGRYKSRSHGVGCRYAESLGEQHELLTLTDFVVVISALQTVPGEGPRAGDGGRHGAFNAMSDPAGFCPLVRRECRPSPAHPPVAASGLRTVRNTKQFQNAVADTLAELARLGATARPGTVADTIEQNVTAVTTQMGIQERSAWRYFSPAGLAKTIAAQREHHKSSQEGIGQAPLPPLGNPELAVILAGVPDSLAENGGDLYAVLLNVAANAWMAGHIHGEDGAPAARAAVPQPVMTGRPG
ncbi:hypothetical protein ABZV15_23825 [Streptomyces sp. NPDC005246]|uniref:hypothetical protein n=1 Tax=Streptomyces sp. NPDC005246 TaxID=3156716 RepID=UPI0033B4D8B1